MKRWTPEQIDARADALRDNVPFNDTGQQTVGMLQQGAADLRDLTALRESEQDLIAESEDCARNFTALREAAQALIAALDRTDIWDDDGDPCWPVPIMQAAGEAVGRLRALLPAPEQELSR